MLKASFCKSLRPEICRSVFSCIVVPPVSAILLTRKKGGLVWIAMLVSVVGSFFGIYFSTHFNFPAGSSVVAILGLIFLAAAVVRLLRPTGSIAPPVE